jgi:cytochrome o ubiquinol oxidase subunit IV
MNSPSEQDAKAIAPTHGFPWTHVIGFVASIVLTLLALGMVTSHALPDSGLFAAILVLAILQIIVQLFFFMHFTEFPGTPYHTVALALGLIFTFTVIVGSIWVMTFGGTEAY